MSEVGRTRDAGWEIGVSRTVDLPPEQVWEFLSAPEGTAVWLGSGVRRLEDGRPYETDDGTAGEVRSLHPGRVVRLTWRPAGWDHDSTVQVRVTAADGGRTVVGFHQERLAGADERERQRTHWRAVLDALVEALDRGP